MRRKYVKKSLYDEAYNSVNRVYRTNFGYQGQIFEKTISNHILRNERTRLFLNYIESIFIKLIDSARQLQLWKVYTVSKKYDKIR